MDDARFDRQRRNVMVTSAILLGARLAGADFEHIRIFDLTPKHPTMVLILWAVVIAYFMWRLLQVTGKEQVDDVQALYDQTFAKVMVKIGKTKVLKDRRAEFEHEARENDEELVSLSVSPDSYKADRWVFSCKYDIGFKSVSEKGERNGSTTTTVKFSLGDPEFEAGKRWTYFYVVLRRKVFTEYVLPYVLGATAIAVSLVSI